MSNNEIEHRNYPASSISHLLAVGEYVEIVETVWGDEQDRTHSKLRRGKIKHVSQETVTIAIEYPKGEILDVQVDRTGLQNWINGPILIDAIALTENNARKRPQHSGPKDHTHYVIYTLSDPRDSATRYVGISKDMNRRLKEHLACVGLNFQKNIWIQELLYQNLQPVLTILEKDVIGLKSAKERERHWIQHYLSLNSVLTNIADVEDDR